MPLGGHIKSGEDPYGGTGRMPEVGMGGRAFNFSGGGSIKPSGWTPPL